MSVKWLTGSCIKSDILTNNYFIIEVLASKSCFCDKDMQGKLIWQMFCWHNWVSLGDCRFFMRVLAKF